MYLSSFIVHICLFILSSYASHNTYTYVLINPRDILLGPASSRHFGAQGEN